MSKAYGTVPMISTEQITQTGTLISVKNKQGHSCCGGCCDVRRAVVVVDLVMIIILLLDIFGLATFSHLSEEEEELLDDDELQTALATTHSGMKIFSFVMEIILLSVAIWGAVTFSAPKVAAGLAVFGIGCVMSMIEFNLPAVVTAGLFAYPHYFLYQEIVVGIMSEDNYYNEEQSCCCV
jgi:hypothetical protein